MRILKLWLCVALLAPAFLQGAYTLMDGRLVDKNEVASMPPEEHQRLGYAAMEEGRYKDAAKHFNILVTNFTHLSCATDSLYPLAVSYFHSEEYELANIAFSDYIACNSNPIYFQEAIEYKFNIAEKFRNGARRRVLGGKILPKLQSGYPLAIQIYDEVVAAVPNHDLAAHSLYAKGNLYWSLKEYRDSVEAFQVLIRRFPKHELTPEAYLSINKVFSDLARLEFGNPDILVLAEMNCRKFQNDFPREERLAEAEQDVLCIKEIYANGLYQIGCFYERMNKPQASLIYYHKALQAFPDTSIARCCRNRIQALGPKYTPEMDRQDFDSSTS